VLANTPTPCKILPLELSSAVGPLTLDGTRYRAVGVFYLLHGVPLGHRYLSSDELPLTAEQVWSQALEAILPALTDYLVRAFEAKAVGQGDQVAQLASLNPLQAFGRMLQERPVPRGNCSVSVVVCTHERPDSLANCLAALQRFGDPSVEYIVVDNAPRTDTTRGVVLGYPNIRYHVEPRAGLSHARNAGVRCAHGDIIAFTDDDVTVTENWICEVTRPFADPDVMCATGLVLPAEMASREQSLFEHWLSFNRNYLPLRFEREWLRRFRAGAPVWQIGAGANMAIRRSAFERVGYFDTRLGAGASGCSEDSEFWYRLLSAGLTCEYAPAAFVLHRHRVDQAGLVNQMRMYARGHATALIVQFMRHGAFGNLFRLCFKLPAFYLRKLASTLVVPEWRPYWLAALKGHFAGFFYLLTRWRDKSGETTNERLGSKMRASAGTKCDSDSAALFSRAGSHVEE
jgi:GT2 family glycosyltransferase